MSSQPPNTLAAAALSYAERGYEVFPVNERDKTPLVEHGMKDATTDAETIRQWWKLHPAALIGCRVPENMVVLDIDPRHSGGKVWAELERCHGVAKTARVHASGREDGGRHYWFERGDIEKLSAKPLHEWARANRLGQASGKRGWTSGIDVLHHGWRYTILPPSPHPETGKPYRWLQEGEPSPLPSWLAPMVAKPAAPLPSAPTTTPQTDSIADWYTQTATWADILAGWTVVEGDGESDGSKWRHPTATASASASIKHGCLFVYTPNTDLEETEEGDPHGYTKFRAWTELQHGGDLKAAAVVARELRDGPPAELRIKPSEDAEPAPRVDRDSADLLALLVNWPDFWAHDHSAEEWVAWPLIPAGRQTALFAPAKSGKSLLTLAVCAAVATGRDILGQKASAGPRNVLYLDYEMTSSDLYERLEALGYGPDDNLDCLHYALLPSLPPLNTKAGCDALRQLAALCDAEVVVIDTMGRAVVGEENSADSYREFARLTGLLLKADGRAVLRTDHAGKEKDRGQRGSSAKNDDVDVVLRIDPVEGGWALTRTHTRISWVPDRVVIKREEVNDVVRLAVAPGSEREYPPGTKELADELRSLGATAETKKREAESLARQSGWSGRSDRIGHALRWIREEEPTFCGKPSGTTPGTKNQPETGTVAGTEAKTPAEPLREPREPTSDANGNQGGPHSGPLVPSVPPANVIEELF